MQSRWFQVSVLAMTVLSTACMPRLYTDEGDSVSEWVEPTNEWPVVEPPEELSGQGFAVGQTPPDVRLVDQHGDEVSLWQFYGKIVLFDISTMWCGPCQELATGTQETQEHYPAEDFVYITVLQQGVEGGDPTVEDLEEWAETFGMETPVLSDPQGAETSGAIINNQFPALLLMDREMVIEQRINPVTDEAIRAAVDDLLAEG